MGTSELDKGKPVLALLAPTHSDAASFVEPAQCSLHDPTARRIAGFARYGTLFGRLTPPSAVLDMRDVTFSIDQLMDIRIIIALVGTKVLLAAWPRDSDR